MIKNKFFKCKWCNNEKVEGILDFTKKYKCWCPKCADIFYMDAGEDEILLNKD